MKALNELYERVEMFDSDINHSTKFIKSRKRKNKINYNILKKTIKRLKELEEIDNTNMDYLF